MTATAVDRTVAITAPVETPDAGMPGGEAPDMSDDQPLPATGAGQNEGFGAILLIVGGVLGALLGLALIERRQARRI